MTLAIAHLAGQVRQAAAVRGFDDCFLVAGLVCVAGVAPALLLRPVARPASPPAIRPDPAPVAPAPAARPAPAGD
jgi:hypothetical protein